MTEKEYDEALREAENVYKRQSNMLDPYAFHRAVESLPLRVLAEILERKGVSTNAER